MRYQLILETKEIMDDQTFEKIMASLFRKAIPPYKIVMARSLDGIRPEVIPGLTDVERRQAFWPGIKWIDDDDLSDIL